MNVFEKMNWTLLLGILGGFIVIFAAFAQWNEKKKEELKADLNQRKADSVQTELGKLQSKNLEKTEELVEAYKQVTNLQKEIKNQITGGNSIPFVKLTTTKIINDEKSGKKYFIIFFNIELIGKYPLQNVKCTIYDQNTLVMLNYGVLHIKDGLSYLGGTSTAKDINNYNPVKKFDLGTLTVGNPRQIYMATVHYNPPKSAANFNVELNWNNGSLTHYIHLVIENSLVKIGSVELIQDGEKVKEYGKFIKIENGK